METLMSDLQVLAPSSRRWMGFAAIDNTLHVFGGSEFFSTRRIIDNTDLLGHSVRMEHNHTVLIRIEMKYSSF